MSPNTQFRVRCVGDQSGNHVLIRVRYRTRASQWVSLQSVRCTRQRGIYPNHSRLRTRNRWPHRHLGTSLSLAPADQFRTETTSLLTTILWLIAGSTHSSASFDVTLNSSCALDPPHLDINSRRLWRTSTLVTVTLTLGNSPCDSHLNRHVLAATSLVWPLILAHHLVHLGNVTRRTRLLHSTLLLNTEAFSNQLLLVAAWVVLGTLVVAWKSRHTRVVLHGLASCRALSKLLGQLTEHLAQWLGLALDLAAP